MKTINKSFSAKFEEGNREWWIVDVAGIKVGRAATHIANLIRGKHKPTFTPNVDNGDFVVVVNTDKVVLTGSKWTDKKYFSHSRFFGSLKEKTAAQKLEQDPSFIIHEAVRGMLPTNKLSYKLIQKLKAFPGGTHTHSAQKPKAYVIPTSKKN